MGYRAALIGCGKIGSEFADDPLMKGDVLTHAEAYRLYPGTELVAVCDTDPDRLARSGERWDVDARYSTVEELMEAGRPDFVSVCTPDETHYDVMHTVLTSTHRILGVLCEKPLATSLEQAQELVRLANERGVILAVEYMRRYAENIRNLKAFLAAGKLGGMQAVSGWYTKGTLHNGSHWFDLLRYLVGEVRSVMAINALNENGPDPTLDVTLELTNGVVATLRACDARYFTVFEMDIMGTQGRVQLVDSSYKIELSHPADSPHYTGYKELQPVQNEFGSRRDLLLHAVKDLERCANGASQPLCSSADGLAALEIALAAHEAARSDHPMTLRHA